MPRSNKIKTSRLECLTAFMIALILFTGNIGFGAASTRSNSQADFTIPVKIETFGNAWNGYLAFGLWYFPYGASNFSLTPDSYLVVMTSKGQLLYLRTTKGFRPVTSISGFAGDINPVYAPIKYLGNDIIMFEGEPDTATHFWNLQTNATIGFPNVNGHHDMIYNPNRGTFLTLRSYVRKIEGTYVLMDDIVELDKTGNSLWVWDTYQGGHFGLKDACLCNATTVVNGQTVLDLTHANSLQWDFQTNMIYMNMRHLDTFCKINKTTNQTVWCLGRRGNFKLLGPNGKQVPSLWYHSHDLREIAPDVFSMFDDDYDNTTNPANPCPATFEETNGHSRMLVLTANEQNMTAWTTWSWTAPREYWTPYWGSVDQLPNGDWIGDFGSQSHYLPGSGIGSPLLNSTGAVLVEVNPKGQVVRTYTFAYAWGIYRVVPISLSTVSDYDGRLHTDNFTINLHTINDLGGAATIYYRINGGATMSVANDGQPRITTQGLNNTLEYWSVDAYGIGETPHNILTGISLKTGENGSSTLTIDLESAGVVLVAVAVVSVAILGLQRRRRKTNRN